MNASGTRRNGISTQGRVSNACILDAIVTLEQGQIFLSTVSANLVINCSDSWTKLEVQCVTSNGTFCTDEALQKAKDGIRQRDAVHVCTKKSQNLMEKTE
jgi:hypothetical protein